MLGVADGRRHPRARGAAELHRRRAHPSGRAVHQQAFAQLQLALREERVMRGGEHLRKGACGRPVERPRHLHQHALVHRHQLGLAGTGDQSHDPLADREPLGTRAVGAHLAGELHPRHVGGDAGGWRVVARPLEDVGTVEAGGVHLDQHLVGRRLGIRALLEDDAAVLDDHCAHS